MKYDYSRKLRVEKAKNTKRVIVYLGLTVLVIVGFIFFGLPTVAKFAAFLTDLRSSTTSPEATDQTPPPPPKLDALPSFTKETEIEVSGTTEPGVTVFLFFNNKKQETLSNSEGKFSYKFPLKIGENSFSALAKDSSGNESQKTEDQVIIFDNEPPDLTISRPEEGTNFYGSRERQIVIEGETEESAQVSVNGRLTVVDSEGRFTFATTLSEGENSFTIKAEDQAGNSTEESLTVNFTP